MIKRISGLIVAFAALTIFGMTSVSAVVEGVGDAVNEVVDGAGDAVNGVVEGAEDVVGGITGEDEGEDEVHAGTLENETTTETATTTVAATTTTASTTTAVTTTATASTTAKPNVNPTTGSFEVVTFGAVALGSFAIAAATTRKKRS